MHHHPTLFMKQKRHGPHIHHLTTHLTCFHQVCLTDYMLPIISLCQKTQVFVNYHLMDIRSKKKKINTNK